MLSMGNCSYYLEDILWQSLVQMAYETCDVLTMQAQSFKLNQDDNLNKQSG